MWRALVTTALLLLAALPFAAPAEASCQTPVCHYRSQLGSRDAEAALRERLLADPSDAEAVRELLRSLAGKLYRERAIADYERRYTWQPAGPHEDLEARIAAERRTWTAVLAHLESDDPSAWCRHAAALDRPEERLAAMRARLSEPSEDAEKAAEATREMTLCLARELVAQERRDEAAVVLRTFLDAHPERAVFRELAVLLDGQDDRLRALWEEQAARRPDDPRAQLDLLRFALRPRCGEATREKARVLALQMLSGPLPDDVHREVCFALQRFFPEEARGCLWRLYDRAAAEGRSDDAASPLHALLNLAIGEWDWPAIEAILAVLPEGELVTAWGRIVGVSEGELCPRFLAAVERGIPREHEWHAHSLAHDLHRCGAEARARALLAEAGLLRPDGSDPTQSVGVESLRRYPMAATGDGFPPRHHVESTVERPAPSLRADLRRWARESPGELTPWIYAAALAEAAGDAGEAMAHWEGAVASRPDDLDLQVALGAAALRLGRPDRVRAAARRLLRDPAAKARHRAEADYLLGRLARREGRWDEASDRLTAYFLRRLRFAGCRSPCDRGLLLHLVEAGHGERLARYLERRAAALADHLRHLPVPDWPEPCHGVLRPGCPNPLEIDPSQLTPESLGREHPEGFPDPEEHFPDDELLALSWQLREVG